jgi:hypothetical protein
VLLDPPHYGRGPKGETWQFEDQVAELVHAVRDVLAERSLVVLSTYAIGCTPLTFANLFAELGPGRIEAAELAGCTPTHIARLCRAGAIDCKKIGREWLVSAKAAASLRGSLPRSLGAAKKSEPVARRPRRK